MTLKKLGRTGTVITVVGASLVLVVHWMVFHWVPTEAEQGIVQRIFYLHAPSAWVAEMAFVVAALCSAIYLWLGDERLDMAALSAAEGGLVFTGIVLITGPIWGKIAWGTWWTWEPRLTFTLLLFFIYLGYFLVRSSTEDPQRGKRFAAVVAIIGALDIPLIHMSVVWFRSLHPGPVVLKPEGPSLDPDMLATLLLSFLAFTLLFVGLLILRYALERVRREERASRRSPVAAAAGGASPPPRPATAAGGESP